MEDPAPIKWLLEHGAPAIRCRTATGLMDGPAGIGLDRLSADMIGSPMVQRRLARLERSGGLTILHGSLPDASENACGKFRDAVVAYAMHSHVQDRQARTGGRISHARPGGDRAL